MTSIWYASALLPVSGAWTKAPGQGAAARPSIAPTAPGSGEALTSTERSDVATALLRRCERSSSAIVSAKLATATSGIIQNMRAR